jgi:DmsE family decaheme c-type cytochrome
MKKLLKALPRCLLASAVLPLALSFAPGALMAQEYTDKGADDCLKCHRADKWGVMPIFKTKHGSQVDPDAPFSNQQCESCHGPSKEHAKARKKSEVKVGVTFGKGDNATVTQQNEACLTCHKSKEGEGWHGSAHESVDVACVSCHQIHVERDPVFDPLAQQETCFNCHPRQRSDTFKSYGHPLRFGGMTCSGCHNPHDGNSDFLLVADTVNDTCYTCHAEKRGPFLWEHAPVTEDCTLCHKPHGSNHPASLTRRPPQLCQQCHSAAGHPGDAYTGDDLDSVPSNRYMLARGCMNCHSQVHGSNHPSGPSQLK